MYSILADYVTLCGSYVTFVSVDTCALEPFVVPFNKHRVNEIKNSWLLGVVNIRNLRHLRTHTAVTLVEAIGLRPEKEKRKIPTLDSLFRLVIF